MDRSIARAPLVVALLMAAVAPPVPSVASAAAGDPVLVGAGDIGDCTTTNDESTAALLDAIDGTVITLGDNAYPSGSGAEFRDCYGPTWGRHKARTHPTIGNHEYETTGAKPYFAYFGAAAGTPGRGWYSFDLGTWHIVVLNSECDHVACGATSPQVAWLRADLTAHAGANVLAAFHEPLASSGFHGGNPDVRTLWEVLYAAGADLILDGHDHDYERFAPQDPWGRPDPAHGIREFVVGTGGTKLRPRARSAPNSEVFGLAHGVLKLTLHPEGYDWTFVPIAGDTFRDTGSGSTHGPPPPRTRTVHAVTSDAWVDQAHRRTNHGTSTRLSVDGDRGGGLDTRAFLKIRVVGVSGVVDRAALRVWVTGATRDGPTVSATTTAWSGRTLTWANQPAAIGPPASDAGPIPAGHWFDLDVTSLVRGDGAYAFVLKPTSNDGLDLSSLQGSHPPRLIVETVPGP